MNAWRVEYDQTNPVKQKKDHFEIYHEKHTVGEAYSRITELFQFAAKRWCPILWIISVYTVVSQDLPFLTQL